MKPPTVLAGDNLKALQGLKASGARFDLIELDGPYMAGLEDWDNMTEAQYIAHYAERLSLVRDVLQPWGVVFVFGYPEGCAEIKSWARQTETLYLRRWLTWLNQIAPHEGRKTQTILFFTKEQNRLDLLSEFGHFLKSERLKRGWSLKDLGTEANKDWWHRGGNFYFETGRTVPSRPDFEILRNLFGFNGEWNHIVNPAYILGNYDGLTNKDIITGFDIEKVEHLNDNGLRSKPVGLYLDLFRPTIPPTENKQALILYGGSGNAGIAAAALGYHVTICEQGAARCKAIEKRWDKDTAIWEQRASNRQIALPLEVIQPVLI